MLPSLTTAEAKECSRIVLEEEAPARILGMQPKLTFKDIQHSLIYLPLYVSTYTHSNKKYQFVISGQVSISISCSPCYRHPLLVGCGLTPLQTGEIYGERPYGIGQAGSVLSSVKKWFSGSRVR